MLRAVSPICWHNLRIMLKIAGFAVAVSHWPQALAVGVWGGFGSSRAAPPCRPRAGSLCPAACHGGAACVRAVAVGGRGMAVCRPRPWRHVWVAPRRAMPTPWRPAVCKTARFALPNGPFQGAIRAVRQPHSGRLGSQGANSGSGAEQKRHFCFRLQTFLLNLHEISSAQPPGSRSGPQAGSVHRGGAACKPKCDEE